MGDLERKGLDGLFQEGDRAALGLIIPDGQVDEAGGAVNGDIEVPLTALAVLGAQLGPVLHVPVHEAKIVVFEGPVRFTGVACGRQTAQALGFQDAVDRVSVQVGQKVRDHEGEVYRGESRWRAARRRRWPALPHWPSKAACEGGSSGPGSRLHRACATCGWSRWTRGAG